MKQSGAEFHEWPLSPLQKEIVAQLQLVSTRARHIQQICLTLKHELDISHFVEAWRSLALLEPALCTQVVQTDHEDEAKGDTAPKQVTQAVILPVETYNWEPLPLNDRETAWENLIEADQNVGFDLAHPPYLRVTLIKCGPAFYYCLCSFHTLLMDDISVPLLLQKVFERYKQSLTDSIEASTSQPRPQTANRSLTAFHSFLKEIDTAEAHRHWADHLADIKSPTSLGLMDRSGTEKGGRSGARASKKLSTYLAVDTTDLLKRYIGYHGISFETLFYGVWGLLQYHYTAEELILFGTRGSARETLPLLQDQLGQFSDFLPLCLKVDPYMPLTRYFQAVHATLEENKRHGFIPMSDLKALIGYPEERPLYEAEVIIVENRYIEELRAQDRDWGKREIRFRRESSKPLSLIVMEDDHLVCTLLYDPALYTAKIISRMLEHLNLMLTSISNHGNMPAGTLPFLPESEARFLTERIQQPSAWVPADLPPLAQIGRAVSTHPGKIALIENDRDHRSDLSFVDLQTVVNQMAHFLDGQGIEIGDTVAIHLGRSIRCGQAILAAMAAGAAIVWLNPNEIPARLTSIIALTKPAIILTRHPALDMLQSAAEPIKVIDFDAVESEIEAQPRHTPNIVIEPEQIALIDHFINNDGQLQGVKLSHQGIANLVLGIAEHLTLTEQDEILSLPSERTESFFFDLLLAIGIGSTLHLVTDERAVDYKSFSTYIEKSDITFIQTTVRNWEWLLKQGQLSQNRIKKLVYNGHLSHELTQKLLQSGGELWQAHGTRESTYWTTVNRIRRSEDCALWGHAAPNVKLLILDRSKQVVPFGGAGELYITGPGITQGYLSRSERESPNFVLSPLDGAPAFRTGLSFRYRGDLTLQPLGSIDRIARPAATVYAALGDEQAESVELDHQEQKVTAGDITDHPDGSDFESTLPVTIADINQTKTEIETRPVSQPELEPEKIIMEVEMSQNHPNSENEEGNSNPTPTTESIIANVMPGIPSPELPADASEEAMMQLIQQQFAFQQNLMEIIAAQQKQFQDLMLPLINKIKTHERQPTPLSTQENVDQKEAEEALVAVERGSATEFGLTEQEPEVELEQVERSIEPETAVVSRDEIDAEPVESETLSDTLAAVSEAELPASETMLPSQVVGESEVEPLSPPPAMPEVTLDLPEIEPFNLDQHDEKRELPQAEIGIDLPEIEPFHLEAVTGELDQTAEPDTEMPTGAESDVEVPIAATAISELPSFEELVFPSIATSTEAPRENIENTEDIEDVVANEEERDALHLDEQPAVAEMQLEPEPEDMVEIMFDERDEAVATQTVDDGDTAAADGKDGEYAEMEVTDETLADEDIAVEDAVEDDPIELLSDAELESIFAEIGTETTPPFEESSSIAIEKIDRGTAAEYWASDQDIAEEKAEDSVFGEAEPQFDAEQAPQVEAIQPTEPEPFTPSIPSSEATDLLEESRPEIDDPAAAAGFDLQSELSSLIDAALERISEPDKVEPGEMHQISGPLADLEPTSAVQETDHIPEMVDEHEKPAEVTLPGTVDPTLTPERLEMEVIEAIEAIEATVSPPVEHAIETEKPAEVTLPGTVDPTIVPELTEDEVSIILGVVDDQPARTLYQTDIDEAPEQSTEAILKELENEINQIEQLPLEEIRPIESAPIPQSEITPTSQEVATNQTWLEDDLLRWIEEASDEEAPGQEIEIGQDRQEDTRASISKRLTDTDKTPQPTEREIEADDPLLTGSPHETMKTKSPFQLDIPGPEPESILDQIVEEFEDEIAPETDQVTKPAEEETVISKGIATAEPANVEMDPLDELEALASLDMDDTVRMDPLHPLASVAQPMLPPQNSPADDQPSEEANKEKRASFFDRLKKKINQKKE